MSGLKPAIETVSAADPVHAAAGKEPAVAPLSQRWAGILCLGGGEQARFLWFLATVEGVCAEESKWV